MSKANGKDWLTGEWSPAFDMFKLRQASALSPEQAGDLARTLAYNEASYKSNKREMFGLGFGAWKGNPAFVSAGLRLDAVEWAPGNSMRADPAGPVPSGDIRDRGDGYWLSGESSVRIFSHGRAGFEGRPLARRTLGISFSGSDDPIDFQQDADLRSAFEGRGAEGFLAELGRVAARVAKATVADLRRNPEIAANAAERLGRGPAGALKESFAEATGFFGSKVELPARDHDRLNVALGIPLLGAYAAAGLAGLAAAGAALSGAVPVPAWVAREAAARALGIAPERLAGESAAEVGASAAGVLRERSPESHYALTGEARSVALAGIFRDWRSWDEIAVSGHSLGGNLAGRFAAEVLSEIGRRSDPARSSEAERLSAEDAADLRSRLRLFTFNSIGHREGTLRELAAGLDPSRFREFRDPNDFTESWVVRSNRLVVPGRRLDDGSLDPAGAEFARFRVDVTENLGARMEQALKDPSRRREAEELAELREIRSHSLLRLVPTHSNQEARKVSDAISLASNLRESAPLAAAPEVPLAGAVASRVATRRAGGARSVPEDSSPAP